jgi:hypothetical protein
VRTKSSDAAGSKMSHMACPFHSKHVFLGEIRMNKDL